MPLNESRAGMGESLAIYRTKGLFGWRGYSQWYDNGTKMENLSKYVSDHGARAFKYLKEIGVHSTAFTCALGMV